MDTDLTTGIVRILKPDGSTAGTGFVVAQDGLVATCAHVVAAAGAGPGDQVTLVFHVTQEERQASVEAGWWRDPGAEDVAVLRLEGPLPEGVTPLWLGASGGTSGHPFKTLGFPALCPEGGIWGDGHVVGEIKMGDVQALQLSSSQITPGFSGAPVLDTVTCRVVGIVTSIARPDAYGRFTETAFITPTETLHRVCCALQISDVCPYRRLDAFTQDDVQFFFGRQRVVDRILGRLRQGARFLAVLGPSGSGKSSLVQAGLIPQLGQGAVPGSDRWGVIVTRPAEQPFHRLEADGLADAAGSLVEAVQGWLDRHPQKSQLVLVVDQFEDLLVPRLEALQQEFIAQLVRLLDSALPIAVVVVMRDDFFSRLGRAAPDLSEPLERGLVNVPLTLTRDELRAIVEQPAQVVGLAFEPGLVDVILADVIQSASAGEGQSVRCTVLPLLEFALTQLWERRQDGVLTHAAYQTIGGVAGGLVGWANRVYYALDNGRQGLARRLLTDLVHLGDEGQDLPDIRRRRPLGDLCRNENEREVVHQVVEQLSSARLLVSGRDLENDQETVELIHDALLWEWGLLKEWLQEDRSFLAGRQALEGRVRAWMESAPEDPSRRKKDPLLSVRELKEADDWLAGREDDLTAQERAFVRASVALRERERVARERRRWLLAVAAVAAAVVFVFLWWRAEEQRQRTEEQRQTALSRRLAALALFYLEDQPGLATLLAVEATRSADTVEARQALLSSLQRRPRLITSLYGHNGPVVGIAFSPDGERLAVSSCDTWADEGSECYGQIEVRLWDVSDPEAPILLGEPLPGDVEEIKSVAFGPDERTLFVCSLWGDVLAAWDVSDPRAPVERDPLSADFVACSSVNPYDESDAIDPEIEWALERSNDLGAGVAFSRDGEMLATSACLVYEGEVCLQSEISLWGVSHPESPRPLDVLLQEHPGSVYSLSFSPDGRILASGRSGGVWLWDLSDIERDTPFVPLGTWLESRERVVTRIAFSPDGGTLASVNCELTEDWWPDCTQGEIQLWGVPAPGQAVPLGAPFAGPEGELMDVTFSQDGKTLASCYRGDVFTLWDVTDPRAPVHLGAPRAGRIDCQFNFIYSSDGTVVASDDAGKIPPEIADLRNESGILSPDGKILALYFRDITLQDVSDQGSVGPGGPLLGYRNFRFVTSAAFSPDGETLAFSTCESMDGEPCTPSKIHLWDLSDLSLPIPLAAPLTGPIGEGVKIALSPDGRTLAATSYEAIVLWDVSLEGWRARACRIAGRNLTRGEWRTYLRDQDYRLTCPDLPLPEG